MFSYYNKCGGFREGARRSGGRGFDPNFMAWFWGAPPGGGRGRHRRHFRGRMFDQGDLKYVILQLLADKPRHGYEIIKELEERSGGAYSPSPGTVYPTLTMLEEMGYATAKQEDGTGGKKIYEITQEGRDYLGEHRSTVDDIFERITEFGSSFFGGGMMEVNHAFKDLGRATYTTAPRHARDVERMKRIKDVLERAAREIEEIGK